MNNLEIIKKHDPNLYKYVLSNGRTFSDLQLEFYANYLYRTYEAEPERICLVTVVFHHGSKRYDYLWDCNNGVSIGDTVIVDTDRKSDILVEVVGIKSYSEADPTIIYKYAHPYTF